MEITEYTKARKMEPASTGHGQDIGHGEAGDLNTFDQQGGLQGDPGRTQSNYGRGWLLAVDRGTTSHG